MVPHSDVVVMLDATDVVPGIEVLEEIFGGG